MINPSRLRLRHWATWRRVDFDLDRPGITFLRGHNADAGGSANGAGKSSLMNAFFVCLWGEHQLHARKRSLKSLTRDHTLIRADMTIDNHGATCELRGSDTEVIIDGEKIESRVKGKDRDRLHEMLGVSQELWSSTVHVNGIASNPLVRGTSSNRCQFLERAFDLDRWSGAYAAVGDALSMQRRAKIDLDAAKAELAALPAADDEGDERVLEGLERRLSEASERWSRRREQLAVARSLPDRPPHDSKYYADRCARLERAVLSAKSAVQKYEEWQTAHEAREKIVKRLEEIPDVPEPTRSSDQLRAEVLRVDEALKHAERVQRGIPMIRRWRALADRMARDHGIRYESVEQLRSLCANWITNLSADDSSCPVCGGSLKRRVDEDVLRRLRELMRGLPDDLGARDSGANVAKTADYLERLRTRLRESERADKNRAARRELELELRHARVPPRPPRPSVTSDADVELQSCRDMLDAARRWERAGKTSSVEELERLAAEDRDFVEKTEARVRELRTEAEQRRVVGAKREQLQRRIDSLEGEVAMHASYRALHAAYSPTGMRLWLLSELLEALIAGLNEIARTSRDRVEFGYRLGRNRDLVITASNLQGTFDVRLLSGAEANLFCLSLLSVLLPMLPSRRRSSLLVLDELDGNCDSRTRSLISEQHLPRLARAVKSLIVITPASRDEFDHPRATNLTVEKRGGVSRLLE